MHLIKFNDNLYDKMKICNIDFIYIKIQYLTLIVTFALSKKTNCDICK